MLPRWIQGLMTRRSAILMSSWPRKQATKYASSSHNSSIRQTSPMPTSIWATQLTSENISMPRCRGLSSLEMGDNRCRILLSQWTPTCDPTTSIRQQMKEINPRSKWLMHLTRFWTRMRSTKRCSSSLIALHKGNRSQESKQEWTHKRWKLHWSPLLISLMELISGMRRTLPRSHRTFQLWLHRKSSKLPKNRTHLTWKKRRQRLDSSTNQDLPNSSNNNRQESSSASLNGSIRRYVRRVLKLLMKRRRLGALADVSSLLRGAPHSNLKKLLFKYNSESRKIKDSAHWNKLRKRSSNNRVRPHRSPACRLTFQITTNEKREKARKKVSSSN